MADNSYDLIVIGGGPGGYVAAIRAAQLGMSVACIDKRSTLGGTCLNVGCIPSKALLQSSYKYIEAQTRLKDHGINVKDVSVDLKQMMARKVQVVESLTQGVKFLFKKYKVDFIEGTARFASPQEIRVNDKIALQAKHVIIATGSEVTNLPGVQIDEKQIVSSTGCLELKVAPEHLVVIGGGYIGLELGSVWQRLGSKVTVIEFLDRIVPTMDKEVGNALLRDLQKQGMEFMLSTKVTQVKQAGKKQELTYEPATGGKSATMQCDVILSSVGRRPYTDGLGLESVGIKLDDKGCIPVDAQFRAGANLYAIGDVIAGPMLAHKAEEEGIACVEHIAGQKPHINYDAIPAVIYTHPEVASVGKTEEELKAKAIDYKIGKFPFTANARARSNGDTDGFVKVLTNARTDEVLGVHIIHGEAGTMIAECALAMEYRASAEDIARTCHAHPTLSEAIKEAAMAAYDKPIHI